MSLLEPPDSYFDLLRWGSYEPTVALQLRPQDHRDTDVVASIYCLPSFELNWAVFLLRCEAGQYVIHHAAAVPSLSSGQQAEKDVEILRHERELPVDLAMAISSAFKSVLPTSRAAKPSFGSDGTAFRFYVCDSEKGPVGAQTCSPDPNTIGSKMVDLAESMRSYAVVSEDRVNSGAIAEAARWIDEYGKVAVSVERFFASTGDRWAEPPRRSEPTLLEQDQCPNIS